jgi:hypothetical protein
MRRRTTRILGGLVLLLVLSLTAVAAVDAASRRAADVDFATVRAGTLGKGDRSAKLQLPVRADLLGATWRGDARGIELRAKGSDGRWSSWVELEVSGDGPDPGSAESRASHHRVGLRRGPANPIWVGDAEQVQVRAHGAGIARDVEVVAINATASATPAERRATAARRSAVWVLGAIDPSAEAMPYAPGIRSRKAWGAVPPKVQPSLAEDTGVLGTVIHHTDGTNRYSCSQVPAILRGIQRYHMNSNGWNDIGYNFLVDACGGVWEGREGGITKPVIGAHTMGFNTSTAGIALIGNHIGVRPTTRARDSLRRLVAWRLDIAHVKPTAKMALTARSSDKFPAGSRVVVRAVSGHRDLFPTSCPGGMEYGDLGSLARLAWATGGAKVANITKSYALRNPADVLDPSLASVTARAIGSSTDMQLTIRLVRASTGEQLHTASITGPVISTTWTVPADISVPVWDVRVIVEGMRGTQRARPATIDLLHVPSDPGFVIAAAPNATVAPGGDPIDDQVRLSYTLAQEYRLGAWLYDPATGSEIATLLKPAYVGAPAAPTELALSIPDSVLEGTYELRVGLPADVAVGRSMHRYSLFVDR